MTKISSLISVIQNWTGLGLSEVEYLKREYIRILRKDRQLPKDFLEHYEFDPSQLPGFHNLLELEEYLSELSEKNTGQVTPFMNFYWRKLLNQLLASAPPRSHIHEVTVYVGEVHNPKFNAEMIPYRKQRFLILVNKGLRLFLFRFARILIASTQIRLGERVFEPEISPVMANRLALHEIYLFLHNDHEPFLPHTSEIHAKMSSLYTYAMEQFVLAHEIGHILNSDNLSSSKAERQLTEERILNTQLSSEWKEELLADVSAAPFCHNLIDILASDEAVPPELSAPIFLVAPFIIFRLMQAVEEIARARKIPGWETHPPATLRKTNLLIELNTEGLSEHNQSLIETIWSQVSELLAI